MLGYIYEVRVVEVQTGQSRWSHMGRGEGAETLAFSPDGGTLACAGWRSVKLWNARDWRTRAEPESDERRDLQRRLHS